MIPRGFGTVELSAIDLPATEREPVACGGCGLRLSGECSVCRRPMFRGEPVGCPFIDGETQCDVCFDTSSARNSGERCGRFLQVYEDSWAYEGVRFPRSKRCDGTLRPRSLYVVHGHPSCVRRR